VLHTEIVRSRDFELLVDKTALSSVSNFSLLSFLHHQGQVVWKFLVQDRHKQMFLLVRKGGDRERVKDGG
jgi:hypothetical protein